MSFNAELAAFIDQLNGSFDETFAELPEEIRTKTAEVMQTRLEMVATYHQIHPEKSFRECYLHMYAAIMRAKQNADSPASESA